MGTPTITPDPMPGENEVPAGTAQRTADPRRVDAEEQLAGLALLERILAGESVPFALLRRQDPTGADQVDIISGDVTPIATLAEIPACDAAAAGSRAPHLDASPADPSRHGDSGPRSGRARHETLVLIPYRQIAERDFTCVDDGTPLAAMRIREQGLLPLAEVLRRIPDLPITLRDGGFDVDDEQYARTVHDVVRDEIGRGEGANFVIRRCFVGDISGYTPRIALSFFRRLLERESSAYWTFVIHTGERTLVGASPERHISVRAGTAVMNPISGTYRYPPSGPRLDELIAFLSDRKETDELYMVVDEELKMMARICETGVQVVGPYLREMAKLAHTEYFIEGRTSRDVREILRETMFAPTVTGSPLANACRVISRYETTGRGYYSGVAALIGRDAAGDRTLDSSIIIRTADIAASGRMSIAVGSTLVRHSDPGSEVAETRAKAAGLLAALGSAAPSRFDSRPEVRAALARRNEPVAAFWLRRSGAGSGAVPELAGRRVLVVDAEDNFTAMIAHLLRSMGLVVRVCGCDEPYTLDGHDLVVMGPGPGDPRDERDSRVAHLTGTLRRLLDGEPPFLAVCLSHQVLSRLLGLRVARRPVPNQGVQREIDLFGRPARLGFYNSFAAYCDSDTWARDGTGPIAVSRDRATGEVHALRARRFCSVQFHAESVLSRDGAEVIRDILRDLLAARAVVTR